MGKKDSLTIIIHSDMQNVNKRGGYNERGN